MKIALTNGVFDLLHPGHVNFLNKAARLADRLIVAINSDKSVRALKGPGRPIQTQYERAAVLGALRAVHTTHFFDTEAELEKLIATIRPDFLVKSGYTEAEITGARIVRQYGGEVVILPRDGKHSTTNLINRCAKRPHMEG